ncbi:MAG: 50S ribosomal protein L10 [Deltaproteobacteria bacterium]|nr:50S ribosomal protein L10 [Deltaproteobacteria bacterium]
MNRQEKEQAISEIRGRFQRATVALVACSEGLSVAKVQELRRAIRGAGGEYKVTKNTLARLALAETEYTGMHDLLHGPTGMIFGYDDPVAVTKALVKFAESNEKLSIRAAILGGKLLDSMEVKNLASLPPKEVLLGTLLGLLQAPATQLLRTIQEPGARLARLVDQLRTRLDTGA